MSNTQIATDRLVLATSWILNSGIQSEVGGVYAWYDLKKGEYSHLYSEITGYAITTFIFLHGFYNDGVFIDKARRAAEWIIREALHPCGGVRTRLYKDDARADKAYSFSGEKLFSFDTGMVLYAMVNLYKTTKEERYLQAAKTLAGFLIEKMQKRDGSLSPIYDAKRASLIETNDKWSNQSGGFHAKVSLGLIELFAIVEDEIYRNAAIKLCEYAISTQEDSGSFITDKVSKTTDLHPHCYTAEGLLYTGRRFGITTFVESARKATERAFRRSNHFQRSDILAQALRLGLIFSIDRASRWGLNPTYGCVGSRKIDNLKSLLLAYQYTGKDKNQIGGFLYSKEGDHVNSWCTMFAIQALAMYQDRRLVSGEIELFV